MNEDKTSLEKENQPSCLGAVSRSYLVLYESNPDRISGSIEKFDGEIMSSVNFEANKSEDFATMKKWALKRATFLKLKSTMKRPSAYRCTQV